MNNKKGRSPTNQPHRSITAAYFDTENASCFHESPNAIHEKFAEHKTSCPSKSIDLHNDQIPYHDPVTQNLTAASTYSAATVTPTPTASASIRYSNATNPCPETHLTPWLASARSAGWSGRGPRRRRAWWPSRAPRDPRPATAGRSSTRRRPSASARRRG